MRVNGPAATIITVVTIALAATGCSSKSTSSGASASKGSAISSGGASAGYAVGSSSCPKAATAALAAGADIKVGTIAALSGPSASSSRYSQGVKTYFDKVNAEQGGVAGHKFVLDAKDDQYTPAKTVPQATDLIEQDQVQAILAQVGTPNIEAITKLLGQTCTPDLWALSGAAEFGDPVKNPWVTAGFTPYSVEVAAWVKYIASKKPGASIGYLGFDNDLGASYLAFLQADAKQAGLKVVDTEKYAVTATNTDAQVSAILSANPDFVAGVWGPDCGKFMTAFKQGGFQGGILSAAYCGDPTLLKSAGSASDGLVYDVSYRDPLNTANADDADTMQFLADIAKYGGAGVTASAGTMVGYRVGKLFVDTVTAAAKLPGGLTRVNLMNAAWNISTPLFGSYCGTGKTSGPSDPFVDECVAVLQYHPGAAVTQLSTFDGEGTGTKSAS